MDTSISNIKRNVATGIHLGAFARFFIPLGTFIAPLVLWIVHRDKSEFVDEHGREMLNFQLSLFLYRLILTVIAVPLFFWAGLENHFDFWNDGFHFNMNIRDLDDFNSPFGMIMTGGLTGILYLFLLGVEVYCTIKAALAARDGMLYQYPLSINFLSMNKESKE